MSLVFDFKLIVVTSYEWNLPANNANSLSLLVDHYLHTSSNSIISLYQIFEHPVPLLRACLSSSHDCPCSHFHDGYWMENCSPWGFSSVLNYKNAATMLYLRSPSSHITGYSYYSACASHIPTHAPLPVCTYYSHNPYWSLCLHSGKNILKTLASTSWTC